MQRTTKDLEKLAGTTKALVGVPNLITLEEGALYTFLKKRVK